MTAPETTQFVVPSKPLTQGAAGVGSQRSRRWTDTFHDNYRHPTKFPNGRPFTGEREFKSGVSEPSETAGFITSDLMPGEFFCANPPFQTEDERRATLLSAWEPVWLPLAKYWRFNYRSKRITFALDKMIQDEKAGEARYFEAAAKIAGDNDHIDPDKPAAIPYRLKALLGSPFVYRNNIKLAQAMQAGDPWLLSFVGEPNVELAKILGINVNFIGGRAGDAEYTAHAIPQATPAIVTPEQVLATPQAELMKMIAEASAAAVKAALGERDAQDAAKKQAQRDSMERARKAKADKATAGATG